MQVVDFLLYDGECRINILKSIWKITVVLTADSANQARLPAFETFFLFEELSDVVFLWNVAIR